MTEASVKGVVHLVDETREYGAKKFRKRLVVLQQDDGKWTNYIPVEFIQDGCDEAGSLRVGDEVSIGYKLSGRRWQKDADSEVKFFVNVEAVWVRNENTASPKDDSPAAAPASDTPSSNLPF